MALPTENDVIDAVAGFLRVSGWKVTQSRDTRQRGVDLIASHTISGRELYIEAKGATSSKPESKRYGCPFTTAQVRDHIANVFYEAARLVAEGHQACIAVPKTDLHERYLSLVAPILNKLGIAIFWVKDQEVMDTINWSS